jgi:chromosome segregation ATPase
MAAQDELEPLAETRPSPARNAVPARNWPDLRDSIEGWADTLNLAEYAAGRVRSAEKRSSQAEQELQDVQARLGQEITGLQVRLRAAEQMIERLEATRLELEARARASTERADNAEKYLLRITEVMRPLPTCAERCALM